MDIRLINVKVSDTNKVLSLFKKAAEVIAKKNINHWQYWKYPPLEKIKWVEEGISKDQFFFIKCPQNNIIGMVRVSDEDLLYWGRKTDKSKYIHSLVVIEEYQGKELGRVVLQKIEKEAKINSYQFLRLDSDSKNPKLCSYYEKQGFIKIGSKALPLSKYNLYQKEISQIQ